MRPIRKSAPRGKRNRFLYPMSKISNMERFHFLNGVLETIGTPRALTVSILLRRAMLGNCRNAGSQLVHLKMPLPHLYSDSRSFALDYQATALVSKARFIRTEEDTKEVALASARDAETHCRVTNELIQAYRRGQLNLALSPDILSRIQGNIARVLSDFSFALDRGWGPGRSTSAFGDNIDSVSKYKTSLDVTAAAAPYAHALVADSPLWGASVLNADGPVSVLPSALTFTRGNVMAVVPKNGKTDRVICIEPHLNIRLQLAVGGALKETLYRHGINLRDQSINRRRALHGSRYGHLATIDLRGASDHISRELVYLLLPINWAVALDKLRSPETLWLDGVWRPNEKFSSMGNGFTFELESLIFWAAARAVTQNVTVYGDDIIVDSESAPKVARVLQVLGFHVNESKSFLSGPFRESCGCDAFLGHDITPVKISTLGTALDVMLAHNRFLDWSLRVLGYEPQILKRIRSRYPGPEAPLQESTGSIAFKQRKAVDSWSNDLESGDYFSYATLHPRRKRFCREFWTPLAERWVFNVQSPPSCITGLGWAELSAATDPKANRGFRRSDIRAGKWYLDSSFPVRSWPA